MYDRFEKFRILLVEDEIEEYRPIREKIEKIIRGAHIGHNQAKLGETIQVEWVDVGDAESAMDAVDKATRDNDWFDLVLCDLSIPKDQHDNVRQLKHGFSVLKDLQDRKWPGSVVVLTNFSTDTKVRQQLSDFIPRYRVDELLSKDWFSPDYEALVEDKLSRCVIPADYIAFRLEKEEGLCFKSASMKPVLRELAMLAFRPASEEKLVKLLLLGDPGVGKSTLARSFLKLMPDAKSRPKLVTENCAVFVSEGHGGRIRLFGASNFGSGVKNCKGLFESATFYEKGNNINWQKAGVAFLDEFGELKPDFQSSILVALEEGEVRKEGDGKMKNIGCHVIFATNMQSDEMTRGKKMRLDLLDRIPNVITIPPLSERSEDVMYMIKFFAAKRIENLTKMKTSPNSIEISETAQSIIQTGLDKNYIKSVRQLQSMADVNGNETIITESNLRAFRTKIRELGQDHFFISRSADLTIAEKADHLKLHDRLQSDSLPESTNLAIEKLYEHAFGKPVPDSQRAQGTITSDSDRFILLSDPLIMIDRSLIRRCYHNPEGLRTARNRARARCGIEFQNGNDATNTETLLNYLVTTK